MYRELRIIKHTFNPEDSLDRRYVEKLADSFSMASTEAPIEYKEPSKGATPIATQHRSIYFDPNSSNMSLDSRAIVDELAGTMRAYENTVVDIEGNTDSTGSTGLQHSAFACACGRSEELPDAEVWIPYGAAADGGQWSG